MGMTIRVELQDMKNDDAPFSAASTILFTCTLQPLQESEVLPIARLLISSEPWLTLNSSVEGIKRYLLRSDPALWRFAVYAGIDLAGVVCLRYPWLFGPYLELIALGLPYRRGGIGRDIIGWMEKEAAPVSSNIWTSVSSFNGPARTFYLNLGFEEIAPLRNLIREGLSEILLRKTLTPEGGSNPK